jgi:hypothetical protein
VGASAAEAQRAEKPLSFSFSCDPAGDDKPQMKIAYHFDECGNHSLQISVSSMHRKMAARRRPCHPQMG